MKYLLKFSILLLVLSCSKPKSLPQHIEDEIERRVDSEINPSVSIGFLNADGTMRFYNYMHADLEIQPDQNTLYEIGSITKTFTANLANQYLKEDMYKPVGDFFPSLQNKVLDSLSVQELKNHTSGVPRLSEGFSPEDWSDPFNGYNDESIYEDLESLKLTEKDQWAYSNLGYSILGKIIENKTKSNFEKLMGALLDDAQMNKTFLSHKMAETSHLVRPYNVGTENSYWHFTGPSRYAGGLISCTADMLKYLKFQKENNPLFQTEEPEDLIQTNVPNLGDGKLFYADGWFVLKESQDNNILLHNGGTGGFISFVGFNLKTQQGVVVLASGLEVIDDIGLSLIYPDFELNKPERSIAYEIANLIEEGKTEHLQKAYNKFLEKGQKEDILDIYWLERFHFGKSNYEVSHQLSDIMVEMLPDDWEVYDIKGQNLEKKGQYNKAIEAYQKAKSLNPDAVHLDKKIERCFDQVNQ